MMRTLVINLARATDRMAFMDAQLRALGLPFERVEAVTPVTLSPPASDAVWRRWQRPLRTTEMALCASHMAAWRRVLELNEPCLVLEDDALLSPDVVAFMASVGPLTGVDHISLETRSRKKLVGRNFAHGLPMRRLYQDRTGSAAYIVFPSGAAKLLAHTSRVGGPSDAMISSTYAMRSFQCDPALSVQLDQAERYGIAPALETKSSIDAERKPLEVGTIALSEKLGFRVRRISAQVVMGLRHVIFAPFALRKPIDFSTAKPSLPTSKEASSA